MKIKIWELEDLQKSDFKVLIDGKWLPARPENYKKYYLTFWERFRIAWEVFMCRAEAFRWPGGQ